MVGGLGGGGKAKRGGVYPPGGGPLTRPNSIGDFNEAEEDSLNFNSMSDGEVNAEFEKMLENMNLSEVIKIPPEPFPGIGFISDRTSKWILWPPSSDCGYWQNCGQFFIDNSANSTQTPIQLNLHAL